MKSRFLNTSPRVYIRQKDSHNTRPPVVRTGNQNETGKDSSSFSENNNTLIFEENRVVVAPYMIPRNVALLSGFHVGDLSLTASITPASAFLEKSIEESPVFPYKEGLNPSAFDQSQHDGFPEEVYPGFASPDPDKIAVSFNIKNKQNFDLIKLNKGDSFTDPSGPFYGSAGSGFVYYDHILNRWIDVGNRDPSTGAQRIYDPVFQLDLATIGTENLISSRDEQFLCQFAGSPYSVTAEGPNYVPTSPEDLRTRGYDKIGEPTSFFEAPYAPRYHAPTGSALKLSDYISDPIVVDRISVEMPVTFVRTQTTPTSPGPAGIDDGFGRDIDNYVFFVYVQNRTNSTPDSKIDVSSSLRYLVAKESFCAYNRDTLNQIAPGLLPLHSHSSQVEFQMGPNIASSSNVSIIQSRSLDLSMTFRPSTFDSFFGTTSKLPGRVNIMGGPLTGSVFVQNFWRGGQYASGTSGDIDVLQKGTGRFRNTNFRSNALSPTIEDQFCNPSPRAMATSFWSSLPETYTSGSGLGNPGFELSTVSTLPNVANQLRLFYFQQMSSYLELTPEPALT